MGNFNKFFTVKDYDIKRVAFPKPSRDLDVAVVYSVWTNPEYLKFLYISLASQFKSTDAVRPTIFVFVSRDLFTAANSILEGCPVELIPVDGVLNKYSVTLRSELAGFRQIVLCDCDTFFAGRNKRFYKVLAKGHRVHMMMDPDPSTKVFPSRRCLSVIHDLDRYMQWWREYMPDIERHLDSNRWYLSCLMSCPSGLFVGEEWESHVSKCLEIQTFCDETVFLTYLWSKGIIPSQLSDICDIGLCYAYLNRELISSPGKFSIIHPLHGEFAMNDSVHSFYDAILAS